MERLGVGKRRSGVGRAMQDERRHIDGWKHWAEIGLRSDVSGCADRRRADVLPHHRDQRGVAVGRDEVGEQPWVRLRVERVAQLGHADEHVAPTHHFIGRQRACPARVATDEHETRRYRRVALEQRQGDHRAERMTHEVRPLEAECGDEGRQGVGELRCSPAVVDVGRLAEARRVPGDDGVVR